MTLRPMLCAVALFLPACSPKPPPQLTQAEVHEFVRQYFVAANSEDSSKLMALVSREPTVSSIAHGWIFQGWETIRNANEESAASTKNAKVSIGTVDVVPIGPDTALAVARMKISQVQIGRSFAIDAPGAVTIIVRRTPDGIRLIHEHYSL